MAAAEAIVFAEGSALYNMLFAGKVRARVFVIPRRRGIEARFSRLLDTLCTD
jgi:capsular polysaccharide biosynthesis protein